MDFINEDAAIAFIDQCRKQSSKNGEIYCKWCKKKQAQLCELAIARKDFV